MSMELAKNCSSNTWIFINPYRFIYPFIHTVILNILRSSMCSKNTKSIYEDWTLYCFTTTFYNENSSKHPKAGPSSPGSNINALITSGRYLVASNHLHHTNAIASVSDCRNRGHTSQWIRNRQTDSTGPGRQWVINYKIDPHHPVA